jgi:hypothetical protein
MLLRRRELVSSRFRVRNSAASRRVEFIEVDSKDITERTPTFACSIGGGADNRAVLLPRNYLRLAPQIEVVACSTEA